ncbi:hypothetical protein CVT24_004878 [Panaeolus cyanescens]|uniref:Uncharacterized protein n=1 Tax=Panaeolus cyanescens TaxID=181874 RepID=A0A409V9X4_9AGAR|nr:hypothetical protein CVT24_004878 [Panaeolus cyanescens]
MTEDLLDVSAVERLLSLSAHRATATMSSVTASDVVPKGESNRTVEHKDVIEPSSTLISSSISSSKLSQEEQAILSQPQTTPNTPIEENKPIATRSHSASPSRSPSLSRRKQPPPMPGIATLTDLTMQSTNPRIVGTPFAAAANVARYEYPFPETPATTTSSATPSPQSSTVLPHPAISCSISPPFSQPQTTFRPSSPPPGVVPPAATVPPPPTVPAMVANLPVLPGLNLPPAVQTAHYNSMHPKLKAQNINPPIPPGLAKKKRGWSLNGLNLLGRRKTNMQGGFVQHGLASPSSMSDTGSEGFLSPPASPGEFMDTPKGRKLT